MSYRQHLIALNVAALLQANGKWTYNAGDGSTIDTRV